LPAGRSKANGRVFIVAADLDFRHFGEKRE